MPSWPARSRERFDATELEVAGALARHRDGGRHRVARPAARRRAGRQDPRGARLQRDADQRREHDLHHPQGHRLGGEPGRARHQHELRRPVRSLARARAEGRRRQGRDPDRRLRQCRPEIAAAVARRRSERDRGHRDRQRRQRVPPGQPRTVRLGGRRRASRFSRRRRRPATRCRPAPRSRPRTSAAWSP